MSATASRGSAWRVSITVVVMLCGLLVAPRTAMSGLNGSSCPSGSIAIEPGTAIQEEVDRAGDGAQFCFKSGVHRAQAVRPRSKQRFYGEDQAVLNGSQLLTDFRREGGYWVVSAQLRRRPQHGECFKSAPFCNEPDMVFVDDRPLSRVPSKRALTAGKFYIEYPAGTIYLGDDPTDRKVEVTIASSAFESSANGVLVSNITVEKFASAAQQGAIHAREGTGWIVEDCEVRLNSGAGISVGTGSRVRNCDLHHNGQIGIEGQGNDIRIEGNRIWSNNTLGFDPGWQAGGVKIGKSSEVGFRANHVHHNTGPGLWCDIDCRNIVYEENLVEDNWDIGIFHEISFKAVIRKNRLRRNGLGDRGWFWGADIALAASRDVEISENAVVTAPERCGVMLIDQGRRTDAGELYKTRDNTVRSNEMSFEGAACAGGVSDTKPGNENFGIIRRGNNQFDGNTYLVRRGSGRSRFVWDQEVTDWSGFQRKGLERAGRLVQSER